jgi:cellulose synthase/poly-beta-1,6-N-acetylglucosamine synthase-like glycosyltransferase
MDQQLPPVSVVIVTKNEENIIEETLRSVFDLKYPKFEVIVVDGHSTDRTVEIASKFPVRIYFDNGTVGSARNIGLHHSKYNFIAWIDADNRPTPYWLQTIMRKLISDEKLAGVCPRLLPLNKSSLLASSEGFEFARFEEAWAKGSIKWFGTFGGSVWRKSAIIQAGGFDEKLDTAEDADMGYRIYQSGFKFEFAREAVVYHIYEENIRDLFNHHVRYGRGRMKIWRKHPKAWGGFVHTFYPFFYPSFLLSILLSPFLKPFVAIAALGGLIFLFRSYQIAKSTRKFGLKYALCTPFVAMLLCLAWSWGMFLEIIKRR